jgi:hypothetical protein
VDTCPSEKGLIDYTTTKGIVKHYYGFDFALGGIFAIKGEDFEKAKGFPNFWGWGLEDNIIQDRCIAVGLTIDRSIFYRIEDKRIMRSFDGFNRIVSKRDANVYKYETPDNLFDLKNISMTITNEYINITKFDCMMKAEEQFYVNHDIRQHGSKIIIDKRFARRNWTMIQK